MEVVVLIYRYEITLFSGLFYEVALLMILAIAKLSRYGYIGRLICLMTTITFIA
jgi:hypothetical protein